MKKILLALTAVFSMSASQAQLASGSLAPDFTGTDLNGNTHHLYEILASGKTVVMDISAAWCGPCWNYHNSGALETLHTDHPDDVVVLFVEGESANTGAQITGTSTGTTTANFSQGDWTAGTGYPIIDDASIADLYQISYFPTIYTICPTGIVTETGQLSAAAHWDFISNAACSTVAANDGTLLNYSGTTVTCGDANIVCDIANLGSQLMTSATITVTGVTPVITYNWVGELAQFESATVDLGTATVTGDVVITITSTDGNAANNTLAAPIALATEANTHIVIDITFDNWPEETSWEIRDENNTVVASSPDYSANAEGDIIQENIWLPSTGCYSFTAIDAYGDGMQGSQWGNYIDGAMMVYSFGSDIIWDYDGSYDFAEATAGMNVNTVVGVEEVTAATSVRMYPNPATDATNIVYTVNNNSTVSFEVVNVMGERVFVQSMGNQAAGTYNVPFSVENLASGLYLVNVRANNETTTLRLTVSK